MAKRFNNQHVRVYSEDAPAFAKGAMTVSAGPDNGFNNCLAGHYPGSARHSTTKQAIDNLLPMVVPIATAGIPVGSAKGPPYIGGMAILVS